MRSTVRELNDAFRTTLCGGRVMLTAGITSLPRDVQAAILERVRTFSTFTEANDPCGEHDFGSFEISDLKINWKVDYYDAECRYGSEDPADPLQTTRVLTIMRAEEY